MPSARDEQISRLVDGLRTEGEYAVAAAALSGMTETLLPPFAQRMAVLAVRERNYSRIVAGLRAVVLASILNPERELVINLSLLWNSAVIIGFSAESAFSEVGRAAGVHGLILAQFANRIPSERSIAVMGYSTSGEGSSFQYVYDWRSLK